MNLQEFNKQEKEKARQDLFACCGSTSWVKRLIENFPFNSVEDLKLISDKIWFSCTKQDWLEAFSHHPKIGENKMKVEKTNSSLEWAKQEQSGIKNADEKILSELKEANKNYENKFGYIYIVCATGKKADEMLSIIKERLNNNPDKELHIAAEEQNKITHLRIDKLLS